MDTICTILGDLQNGFDLIRPFITKIETSQFTKWVPGFGQTFYWDVLSGRFGLRKYPFGPWGVLRGRYFLFIV